MASTQEDNLSCQKNQILILFMMSCPPHGQTIPPKKNIMKKVANQISHRGTNMDLVIIQT